MEKQGKVKGFFDNVKNSDQLGSLVDDIRDAMIEYQVRSLSSHPVPPRLISAPDIATTGRFRHELSSHRESCFST